MKIVLDNVIYSNESGGGVSNYWFELSKFLMNNQADQVLFYEDSYAMSNFHRKQLDISESQIISDLSPKKSSIIRKFSRVNVASEEHYLFHSSYYRLPAKTENVSQVTTVHDFTHNYFASAAKRILHNNIKYKSLRQSDGIICISENTYNDLKKFCPPANNQKVAIIHNGVSDDYKVLEKDEKNRKYLTDINVNSPYLLYVGSRVHYKNFSFVASLLKEMPDMTLVIVGGKLSQQEQKLFGQEALSRTTTLNNVSNFDLNILYNFAHAFIYPSSYEGFGIPIIESMRAGCPALALNNSSIGEIAGNAGILFDHIDVRAFKNAIENLSEKSFRDEVVAKGLAHSAQFSWEKCGRETHDFYTSVY